MRLCGFCGLFSADFTSTRARAGARVMNGDRAKQTHKTHNRNKRGGTSSRPVAGHMCSTGALHPLYVAKNEASDACFAQMQNARATAA
jgi:hypothetical protein